MATKTLVLTLRSILRHYGNHVNVFPHTHHYPILLLLLSFSSEIVINETTSFTQSQFHGLIWGDLITCKLVSLGSIVMRRVPRCNYLLVVSPYQVHMCAQTPQVSLLGSLVHYYKQCKQGTGFCWRILIWLQWMLYLC